MSSSDDIPSEDGLRSRILSLLAKRNPSSTLCPSEVARSFSNDETVWRPLMEPIRAEAKKLADEGKLDIVQKGEVVDLEAAKGPIRLRRRN